MHLLAIVHPIMKLTLIFSVICIVLGQAFGASYVVRPGDSLPKIARTYGMGVRSLAQMNRLAPNETLRVGQRLEVKGYPLVSTAVSTRRVTQTTGKVTRSAYRYVGLRYRLGATGRGGIDCSGFTQAVMRDLGVQLPRTSRAQFNTGHHVAKSGLRPGDLVFFNTTGRGVSHAGLYLGNGLFANANSYRGRVVVENLNTSYWVRRYVGARRVLS